MVDKRDRTAEEERKQVAESVWLNYFNNVLYEQHMITEQQRNRITNMIASRKPSATKRKNPEMEL